MSKLLWSFVAGYFSPKKKKKYYLWNRIIISNTMLPRFSM